MSRYIKLDDATNHCETWRGLAKEVNDRNGWWMADNLLRLMQDTPSIDIVRCKECKHYDKFPTWSACTYWSGDPYEQASVNDDDFCSRGERREP